MPKDAYFSKRQQNDEYKFSVEISEEMQNETLHENRMSQRVLGESGYSEEELTRENDMIASRLQDESLMGEISQEMRERLTAQDKTRLARNHAILLCNDKKLSKDSGLMESIKNSLKLLDDELRKPMANGPEEVFSKYESAIALMNQYENTKNPTFSSGKRRKERVSALKRELSGELERLRSAMSGFNDPAAMPEELKIPMNLLEGRHLNAEGPGEYSEKLDERKLELFSLKRKDGEEDGQAMGDIKTAFRNLLNLITGQIEDINSIPQKVEQIELSYGELIGFCNTYIETHSPKSAEGKRRLNFVKALKKRSYYELKNMRPVAYAMKRKKPNESISWKDVFGQVTVMAQECVDARMKTEVILGNHPPMRKMVDIFQSINTLKESHPYKYSMLSGMMMSEWLEDHLDKKMIDDLITERYMLMNELASKYKVTVKEPVPKKYLKDPNGDPMDEKARKAYARLVMTSDPAFSTYKGINSVISAIMGGIDKEKSLFAKDAENPGEYYQRRARERQDAMSEDDKAHINEISDIAKKISEVGYQDLNAEEVSRFVNSVEKAERIKSRKNLKLMLSKNQDIKRQALLEPEAELQDIQSTMNFVHGKAFIPLQRPENRIGTWAKVKNRLKLGYRWLFGASIGTLATVALNSYYGIKTLLYEDKEKANAQEKRHHNMVPGRKDEYFEDEQVPKDENGEDLEVYSDVRRGPLVWEKLSAGDPEDPPEVTIMMSQAKRGSNVSLSESEGHGLIGLSYSRYNKITKRKERYELKMGFYPGGGISKKAGLASLGGAVIGGQMATDYWSSFDVARRYQVKPGDINKILRAAETYADKGYQPYKRNCATFVVDMAKLINLPIMDEVKEDEMVFEGVKGALAETAESSYKAGYYMGANAISSHMNKMDLQYQNFGQKLYTKEDLERYYKTAGTGDVIKRGYSPGAVGETLRYAKSGELTARYLKHKKLKAYEIKEALTASGRKTWLEITKILPEGVMTPTDIEAKLVLTQNTDGGLAKLDKISTPADVRKTHKALRGSIKKINEYYKERLGSDTRVNEYIMKQLSLLEAALTITDKLYQDVVYKDASGDAGKICYDYLHTKYRYIFRGKKNTLVSVNIQSGVYEGYLMAGKTPEQALKDYDRFMTLHKKNKKNMTSKELAEYAKLRRFFDLARDFASANRYLLEKDDFSDKDINYAFNELPAMETKVKAGEKLQGAIKEGMAPSTAYQAVILEKVFGGFRNLKLDEFKNMEEMHRTLDNYIEERLNANPALAERILKIYIGDRQDSAEDLAVKFTDLVGFACVKAAYSNGWEPWDEDDTGLSAVLKADSKLQKWLVEKINMIRSEGGAQ